MIRNNLNKLYKIEEDKITFYKVSFVFKCLIAFIFFITFLPFIFWLSSSKTFIQYLIMFFVSIIFIFIIPLAILLSNQKIEIIKNEQILRKTIYFYKYSSVREIKYSEIAQIIIKPIIKRKNNYIKKWWNVYLKTKNDKNMNLFSSVSLDQSKEVAIKVGKLINVDVINEESKEALDSKLFEGDKSYVDKITKEEVKLIKPPRPKNIYKDDYGKRVIYRWYNVSAFEFTLMFLILFLLLFLDFILYKRKYIIFSTSIKLTLLFVIYFIIRYSWLIFFDKGWCELSQRYIKIRKNILLFPKIFTVIWDDIKDIGIESENNTKLIIKTKIKYLTISLTKDKILWLKNEINNFIRSHF